MTDQPWSLDQIEIASPCSVPWESMRGTDFVRHCEQCRLNVYDLSALTRTEAEALVLNTEEQRCIRFFRRHDGTVLTRDCPVGARAMRRKLAQVVTSIGAVLVLLTLGGLAARTPKAPTSQDGYSGPLRMLANWIDPPPRPVVGK